MPLFGVRQALPVLCCSEPTSKASGSARGMLKRRSIVDSVYSACRHPLTVVNVGEVIVANTIVAKMKNAFASAFAAPQLAFATA